HGQYTRTIDLERYIKDGIRHICDESSYEIISDEQGAEDIAALDSEILKWLHVNEDCGSLIHALGKWVNEMLQPIMLTQKTYFKNTPELINLLRELGPIPSNTSIFTYDAIKMYPSIETEACLERLAAYLRRPETQAEITHYHPDALIEALGLVMRNNRFKFGDVLVKQIKGIAMGMSPAPPIPNLYVAIHEEEEVLQYLACNWLLFLKRFIDDGIGIWLHHPDPAEDERRWKEF
ncbi:hypothetical protein THAOC_27922, partial [Thalassiosira oceanica]